MAKTTVNLDVECDRHGRDVVGICELMGTVNE